MAEILRVGRYGPSFQLRPPHTLESVKADAQRAIEYRPLLCRIWHRRKRIGDVFVPKDPVEGAMALLALSDTDCLTRCRRCGLISVKSRWPG